MSHESAIRAALDVMEAHIKALNARDEEGLAKTLHFPHFRLAGTDLKMWNSPDGYFADFHARAGAEWTRSSVDDVRVAQASNDKVHLDVEINRYGKDGDVIITFRSLWIIVHDKGRWAAKFRSSFAVQ